jgi:hypothetical protein
MKAYLYKYNCFSNKLTSYETKLEDLFCDGQYLIMFLKNGTNLVYDNFFGLKYGRTCVFFKKLSSREEYMIENYFHGKFSVYFK